MKPLGTQKSLENGEPEVQHPQLTDMDHHEAGSSQANPSSSSSSDPAEGTTEGELPECSTSGAWGAVPGTVSRGNLTEVMSSTREISACSSKTMLVDKKVGMLG